MIKMLKERDGKTRKQLII